MAESLYLNACFVTKSLSGTSETAQFIGVQQYTLGWIIYWTAVYTKSSLAIKGMTG